MGIREQLETTGRTPADIPSHATIASMVRPELRAIGIEADTREEADFLMSIMR